MRSSFSNLYPLTLLPVRRADEAFSKTENMLIMTTEICAVQPRSSGALSRTRAPGPLHARVHLLLSVQVESKAEEDHPHPDRKATTSWPPAHGSKPPRPATPVHVALLRLSPYHVAASTSRADLNGLRSSTPQRTACERRVPLTAAPPPLLRTDGPVILPTQLKTNT